MILEFYLKITDLEGSEVFIFTRRSLEEVKLASVSCELWCIKLNPCCGLRRSGPGCSKLTTSLVNVSLKFQTLILQIHCNFC